MRIERQAIATVVATAILTSMLGWWYGVIKLGSPKENASGNQFVSYRMTDGVSGDDTIPPTRLNLSGTERNSLLNQQLELEKQKADLEKMRRENIETREAERAAKEKAGEYSDDEYRAIYTSFTSSGDTLGRLLLSGTHYSGIYQSTAQPLVVWNADRKGVTVSVTVTWKGQILKSTYDTTYEFSLSKTEGATRLRVLSDNAIVQIEPSYLQATERRLKDRYPAR